MAAVAAEDFEALSIGPGAILLLIDIERAGGWTEESAEGTRNAFKALDIDVAANSPGTLTYNFYEDGNCFQAVEVYANSDAFVHHLASDNASKGIASLGKAAEGADWTVRAFVQGSLSPAAKAQLDMFGAQYPATTEGWVLRAGADREAEGGAGEAPFVLRISFDSNDNAATRVAFQALAKDVMANSPGTFTYHFHNVPDTTTWEAVEVYSSSACFVNHLASAAAGKGIEALGATFVEGTVRCDLYSQNGQSDVTEAAQDILKGFGTVYRTNLAGWPLHAKADPASLK